MKDQRIKTLVRNFVVEMLVYALLVVGYFWLVLRLLANPLKTLFTNNLTFYAIVTLVLILAQGVVLEAITSFIIGMVGLDRME